MKKIKLRGKAKAYDIFVYGIGVTKDFELIGYDGFDNLILTLINPYTLSQFIGLYDMNHNELYEGDIVAYENGINTKRGAILFDPKKCAYYIYWKSAISEWKEYIYEGFDSSKVFVVSSIYDELDFLN